MKRILLSIALALPLSILCGFIGVLYVELYSPFVDTPDELTSLQVDGMTVAFLIMMNTLGARLLRSYPEAFVRIEIPLLVVTIGSWSFGGAWVPWLLTLIMVISTWYILRCRGEIPS
jgi:hypothetical protein